MQTDKFVVTVTHSGKFDPVLLGDMIAARAWSMDGVENAEAECITPENAFERMARELKDVPSRRSIRFGPAPTPVSIEQIGWIARTFNRLLDCIGLHEVAR